MVSKSWGDFHFWMNYPFKLWPFSYYQLQAPIYVQSGYMPVSNQEQMNRTT